MTSSPVTGHGVDAFAVLGIPGDPELSDGQVRRAYLRRLRAVHPDAGGDSECAAAVTAAYDALRSPGGRALAAEAAMLAADGDAITEPGAGVTSAAVLERIEDLTSAATPGVRGAVAAGPGVRVPPAARVPGRRTGPLARVR